LGAQANAAAAPHAATVCPAQWRAGWQRLANRVQAPVYCPTWMPNPLDGQIKGSTYAGTWVEPDRDYLVSFIDADVIDSNATEVHVNFRGYPGRTTIPTCEDTVKAGNKVLHPKIPCFAAPVATKHIADKKVTVYTVNQGADTWHVLYAWRHKGSLYAVSEHVIIPYTYKQVIRNLDRLTRDLVLVEPAPAS
jgi:hypothetical protein